MERKAVISGAPDGYWYGYHEMDGSGYLREENTERRIFAVTPQGPGLG